MHRVVLMKDVITRQLEAKFHMIRDEARPTNVRSQTRVSSSGIEEGAHIFMHSFLESEMRRLLDDHLSLPDGGFRQSPRLGVKEEVRLAENRGRLWNWRRDTRKAKEGIKRSQNKDFCSHEIQLDTRVLKPPAPGSWRQP
jgi:hypothetical protein